MARRARQLRAAGLVLAATLASQAAGLAAAAPAPSAATPPATTPAAVAPTNAYAARLQALDARPDKSELFQVLFAAEPFRRPRDASVAEDAIATLDWLRPHVIESDQDVRYGYAYALWLWYSGIPDTATGVFLRTTALTRIDAARCADPTAGTTRVIDLEQKMAPPMVAYARSRPLEERRAMLQLATFGLGLMSQARAPSEWLCSAGMSTFLGAAARDGGLKGTEVPTPPGGIGRTIVIDPKGVKVEFLADAEWATRRAEVIAAQSDSIRQLLTPEDPVPVLPAASAPTAPAPEPWRFAFDGRKWQLGYEAADARQALREYVLEGEKVEAWTELVTSHRYEQSIPVAGFLERFRQDLLARCPNATVTVIEERADDALLEWRHAGCQDAPAQHELRRIANRGGRTFLLAYVAKVARLERAQREAWLGSLRAATLD